jgi:hypothetical protein
VTAAAGLAIGNCVCRYVLHVSACGWWILSVAMQVKLSLCVCMWLSIVVSLSLSLSCCLFSSVCIRCDISIIIYRLAFIVVSNLLCTLLAEPLFCQSANCVLCIRSLVYCCSMSVSDHAAK